jgi:hypothetical protein
MSFLAMNTGPEPHKCVECKDLVLVGELVLVSVGGPSHARHYYTIEDRGDRYLLKKIGHPSENLWLYKSELMKKEEKGVNDRKGKRK